MDIPTPKTAPIKRTLSDEERRTIQDDVLDPPAHSVLPGSHFTTEGDADILTVDQLREVGRGAKRDYTPREHLMQRPFAKNPAFAELARQTRENEQLSELADNHHKR